MDQPDSIELHYQMDRRTILAAMLGGARSFRRGRIAFLHWIIYGTAGTAIWLTFMLIATMIDRAVTGDRVGSGAVVAYTLISVAFYYGFYRLYCRMMADRWLTSLAFSGPISLRFDRAGVKFKSNVMLWDLTWNAVDDLVKYRDGFLVRLGNIAIPAPDSALPQATSRDAAVAQVKSWREAAQ